MSGSTLCWPTKQFCIKVHMKQNCVEKLCYRGVYVHSCIIGYKGKMAGN